MTGVRIGLGVGVGIGIGEGIRMGRVWVIYWVRCMGRDWAMSRDQG